MKNVTLFLLIFLIISCTSNTIYKKPKNLIPKDTMVLLIKEMFIASSAEYQKNRFAEMKVNYMPFVYDKYKIDSTRFSESSFYYISKIDEQEEIYKLVKQLLVNDKKTIEENIRIKDSLKKLKDTIRKKSPKLTQIKSIDSLKEIIIDSIPLKELITE